MTCPRQWEAKNTQWKFSVTVIMVSLQHICSVFLIFSSFLTSSCHWSLLLGGELLGKGPCLWGSVWGPEESSPLRPGVGGMQLYHVQLGSGLSRVREVSQCVTRTHAGFQGWVQAFRSWAMRGMVLGKPSGILMLFKQDYLQHKIITDSSSIICGKYRFVSG